MHNIQLREVSHVSPAADPREATSEPSHIHIQRPSRRGKPLLVPRENGPSRLPELALEEVA